jgi:hypothetical protein
MNGRNMLFWFWFLVQRIYMLFEDTQLCLTIHPLFNLFTQRGWHTSRLLLVRMIKKYIYQVCTSARRQTVVATKFCTLAPDIGGSPAWNFVHVTLPAPKILACLLDFWEVRAPLNYTQRFGSYITENTVIVPLERPNGVRCSLYETVDVNCSCHTEHIIIVRGKKAETFGVTWQHWQLRRSNKRL